MKYLASILIILTTLFVGKAQHGLSFYHLRNATFQNTNFNPAHFPNGRIFIGLPGISGVNVYYNNRHSYNDIFTKDKETSDILVDGNKIFGKLGYQNLIGARAHISLLHVGVRTEQGVGLSFFINERVDVEFNYPRDLMEFIWEGNATQLGEELPLGRIAVNATHFREFGLGYAYDIPRLNMSVGMRAKYYMGIFNASTANNFQADLTTEIETFQMNLKMRNAVLRTSGIDIAMNQSDQLASHIISSGNHGFGVDLGIDYQINGYYSVAVSLLDVGFISWKQGVKNYLINEGDTILRYGGVDLRYAEENKTDVVETIEDSLINQFDIEKDNKSYVTPMVSQAFGSVVWKMMPHTEVIGTLGARMIQSSTKMSYGVGIRQYFNPKLIVSGSVTKLPQQFFNIGAAIAATAGPVQFYLASDKLVGYSVPDMSSFEFRAGINLVFGTRIWQSDDDYHIGGTGEIESGMFLGRSVNVRGHRDIYTIIDRQKRRNPKEYMPSPRKEGQDNELDK